MRQLPVTSPNLGELFLAGGPNDAMLFAALEGHCPGRALVDDVAAPSQGVIRTHYGTTFFSNGTTDDFVTSAVTVLRAQGAVRLVVAEDQFAGRSFPAGHSRIIDRVEFRAREPQADRIAALLLAVPAGCRRVPVDRGLLSRCLWRDEVVAAWGSSEGFLAHGRGLCLMQDDEILSEAYVLFAGAGRMELGVFTSESQRGHNLAAIVCAPLIKALEERGFATYWSCHQSNGASIGVARKLGFRDARSYRWIRYEAQAAYGLAGQDGRS